MRAVAVRALGPAVGGSPRCRGCARGGGCARGARRHCCLPGGLGRLAAVV